jgi:hypothetical protein
MLRRHARERLVEAHPREIVGHARIERRPALAR